MLTREEWEEIQEVRPRTPFESKLARPNARIRTGEKLHMVKSIFLSFVIIFFRWIDMVKLVISDFIISLILECNE